MAAVSTIYAPPARFEVGRLFGLSVALVRERWRTLLAIFVVSLAPRLPLDLLYDSHALAAHQALIFAAHAADRLGAAMAQHAAEAVLAAACLARPGRGAGIRALRVMLRASPVLIPAWVLCETDTMLHLWNDWTQAVTFKTHTARAFGPLGLYGLDVGVSMTAVALVGLFTPAVLFERLGLADGVARAWRLTRGARGKLAAIYLVMSAALIIALIPVAVVAALVERGTPTTNTLWTHGAGDVAIAFVSSGWSVLIAAAYLEQRRLHEGALPDQIAETFG